MSNIGSRIGERAADLRREFDRSFADPVRIENAAREDLLVIRVGGESYALRLVEIAGLFADKKVTRVPGSETALLGIAGFRGAVIAAYSLQALLGGAAMQIPRWLVLAATQPVALAFEAVENQLSVPPDAILAARTRGDAQDCVREFVRTQNFTGPIMHLPSVLGLIKSRRGEAAPIKER